MITLALSIVAAHQGADVAKLGFDPARLDLAREGLRRHMHEGHLAGAVTLILKDGKEVRLDTLGYADLKAKTLMKRDTLFQVKSMTKPVTAAAAMICVERGLLGLSDPVSKYLPQFADIQVREADGSLAAPRSRLLVRHLMTHTSGLASDDPGGLSDEAKALLTLKEYSKLLGTEPLVTHPGEVVRYSGVGFSTLAAIVESVSKMPFDQFVEMNVFGPLGMNSTHFFLPRVQHARLAQVYSMEKGALVPFGEDRFRPGAKFANAAGGLYSTAEDMAKFIDSFRTGAPSALLSNASVSLMTKLGTGELLSDGSTAQGYGLGWAVIRSPAGQTTLRSIGSFGHTGAFGTEFWHDQATGITVVFMAQTFFIPEDARRQFSTMVNASYRRARG